MSKLALLFFFILISVSHAAFMRPWDNSTWMAENPSIWSYGIRIWWDLGELDKTLQSVGPAQVPGINGSAKSYAEKGLAYREAASANKDACLSRDIAGPVVATLIAGPMGGAFMGAISEFSSATNCMAYGDNWKNSVDSFLLSLESSTKESEDSISEARKAYSDVEFMGLCQPDYTRSGSEACPQMRAAFAAVDNNITEGGYGKFALLRNYSRELEHDLKGHTPDLAMFGSISSLAWGDGGIIDSFEKVKALAESSKGNASSGYSALEMSAEGRKAIAAKELSELEKEGLDLITIAPTSEAIGNPGSISERYKAIKGEEDRISIAFRESQLERSRIYEQGYLAAAIEGMALADSDYSKLIREVEDLESDAQDAAHQQETEAKAELLRTKDFIGSDARSTESVSLYRSAEEYCDDGDDATTLGIRFRAFSRCAALSREARLQRDFSKELSTKASLSELGQLIQAAEKDGINVVSERESLDLLDALEPYEIGKHLESAQKSIILKAKAAYDDELLAMRASLLERIRLSGDAASDLLTDIDRCEDGLVSAGAVDYPQAIGSLKTLKACYLYTDSELEQHMADIVSGSVSSSAAIHLGDVALDRQTNVTIDILLANTQQYKTSQITADVALPSAIQLLRSDISYGYEGIRSIRQQDKGRTLSVTYGPVEPFETRRIIFEKSMVVANTLESRASAEGIGNGMASIDEEIEFELEADVPRLLLDDRYDGASIDGIAAQRPLKAGKHTLAYRGMMEDAYQENITNIKAYRVGLNSHVEYSIRILPKVDLASIPILIDSINDSRIRSLDVASITGEKVSSEKRVSQTQFMAKVSNLRKASLVILKVRYDVEDTESFVKEQLSQMNGTAFGNASGALFYLAKAQAEAGNYTEALELIERSKALAKEEEKERSKLEKGYAEQKTEFDRELKEIRDGLSSNPANSTFVSGIRARESELSRISEELESLDLKGRIALMERHDPSWLEKGLKAFGKASFKDYNDLRERLFLAGNTGTPAIFLEAESAMNKLESGIRLEYALEADRKLAACEALVEAEERRHGQEKADMAAIFDKMESDVSDTLERYSRQASAAKGTEYSSLFSVSESRVKDSLKDTEKALKEDPRLFQAKAQELNHSRERMELVLSSLASESRSKLALIESIFSRSGLGGDDASEMREKISAMRGMVESGEYVNALRAGSKISKELDGLEPEEGSSLLLLGLSALAILAIAGFYMYSQKKEAPLKPLKRLSRTEALERLSEAGSSPDGRTGPKPSSDP